MLIKYNLFITILIKAAMLLLVKCYDRKKVKSFVDLTIFHVVWSLGVANQQKKLCAALHKKWIINEAN